MTSDSVFGSYSYSDGLLPQFEHRQSYFFLFISFLPGQESQSAPDTKHDIEPTLGPEAKADKTERENGCAGEADRPEMCHLSFPWLSFRFNSDATLAPRLDMK